MEVWFPADSQSALAENQMSFKDRRKDRLLRLAAVISRTGLSEATIKRRERAGTFPKREPIGGRCVAWYESDIADFVANPLNYRSP